MIIGLGYKARSGKTTIANYLRRVYGFRDTGFAEELRASILDTLGIYTLSDEDKAARYPMWGNRSGREILQQYGTEGLRNGFDPDIWVKLALYNSPDYTPRYSPEAKVVFYDLRFENEAEEIRKLGGILIRIDRDEAGLEGATGAHASENGLNDYPLWDYVLDNNGDVDELHGNVDALMEHLGFKNV